MRGGLLAYSIMVGTTPQLTSRPAPWPRPPRTPPRSPLLDAVDAALRGELIKLGLAIVLRESPLRLEQPLVFQSPESGIERPLFHQQCVIALPPDQVSDGIPVKRAPDQGLEDKDIQRATQKFEFGGVHSFPLGFQGKDLTLPRECKGRIWPGKLAHLRRVTRRAPIGNRNSVAASFRHAVTILAAQLFTNAPKRSSALQKFSPTAAKPRRKCEGVSKQSPGASRIPYSVAAWQNGRSFSPLASQGNAVMPPRGGIQQSTSRCSSMNCSRSLRFRVAVSCALPSTMSRLRIATSERISPVVL